MEKIGYERCAKRMIMKNIVVLQDYLEHIRKAVGRIQRYLANVDHLVKIGFLKPAERELDDAFECYESEQPSLGFRFQTEVAHSLSRIMEYPLSYQEIGKYFRRCLVHKFPSGVIYRYVEHSGEILVAAIAHLHRRPDYWFSRKPLPAIRREHEGHSLLPHVIMYS